ncbi:hypothetical protein Btru_047202, partial [Bulinus truncatus]
DGIGQPPLNKADWHTKRPVFQLVFKHASTCRDRRPQRAPSVHHQHRNTGAVRTGLPSLSVMRYTVDILESASHNPITPSTCYVIETVSESPPICCHLRELRGKQMETVLYTFCITLAIFLLLSGPVKCDASQGNEALQNTLIRKMDVIQNQLAEVTSSIQSLHSDIDKALVNCEGIESDLCDLLALEDGQKGVRDVDVLLRPNKRSFSQAPQADKYRSLLAELSRKREMAKYLMHMLRGADVVVTGEKKRACNLNLGFHCQTEEISNFADMFDYLSNPLSPGKKRSYTDFICSEHQQSVSDINDKMIQLES